MMNKKLSIQILGMLLLLVSMAGIAQNKYKLHAHNDYEKEFPFWEAYIHGANSIEADVFLKDEKLYVTHAEQEINDNQTLKNLYLDPISQLINNNELRELQLLVDIKSEAYSTLQSIIEAVQENPELTANKKLRIVISGNRPAPEDYIKYPEFIQFDHQSLDDLDKIDLEKVAMISKSFGSYSHWNGLGRLTETDLEKVKSVIKKAHSTGKPFRFWGAPDTKTAWSRFANQGVDFINTDDPALASAFLKDLDNRTFTLDDPISVYKPQFDYDTNSKPKNVILMIGDGNGLSQISAALIANRGELTLTQLQENGLIKTSSFDDLVTDSAAGATAMATGTKTNNRAIGTAPNGKNLKDLTEILSANGFINGIITTDKITGATPASFFAHQIERDNSDDILKDLNNSKIDFFISEGTDDFEKIKGAFVQKEITQFENFDQRTAVYLSPDKSRSENEFTKDIKKVLHALEDQDKPYFLMIEGAKIDSNGHANNTGGIINEMLDFDKAIAEVLKTADKNKNTLVVITADHETSGFGIMQGNLKDGTVEGDFLSNDHTATMVPVFSYGPQAHNFTGIFENTAIFDRILKDLEITR